MGKNDKPCPQCGYNKWKTKQKNHKGNIISVYQCRNCLTLRVNKKSS